MHDHRVGSFRAVARERLLSEPLAGSGELDVTVTDATHPFLPSLVEHSRAQTGGARQVRIHIGHHVDATRLRPLQHPQRSAHLATGDAADVHYLRGGSRDGGGGDHFLDRGQAAVVSWMGAEVADM